MKEARHKKSHCLISLNYSKRAIHRGAQRMHNYQRLGQRRYKGLLRGLKTTGKY